MAKLRPRARIIRTIGDQLISGPDAAIIELVKNSYDAEATESWITFNYSETEGFSIVVSDNGHGMTYDEILQNWLEPATDVKVKEKYSKNGSRKVLGAKGIGRFAVSRLGKISMLTSVAFNENSRQIEQSSVCIDWSDFTAEQYLEDIDIDIAKHPVKSDLRTGVTLEITELRDAWSKKQLERLIIELRRLAYPNEDDPFHIFLDLESFNYKTVGFDGTSVFLEQNSDINSLSENITRHESKRIRPFVLGEIADYKLEGRFDAKGDFNGYFQVQRGDKQQHPLSIKAPKMSEDEAGCGPLDIELNIFDREHDAIKKLFERMGVNFEKIGIRKARKILTDMSGISISRGGFRIRPYGTPEHDWLELQAKRVQDPSKKLGSDQVSGHVAIADEKVSGIVERSSREGLEINSHFIRLKNLINNLLPHVEERRYEFREKAGIARRPSSNVEKARKAAKLSRTSRALGDIPEEFREKIENAIKKDAATLNEMLDEVDSYQKLLQSRAALGLVVAEVIHEGRRHLDPMLTSIKTLKLDWKHAFEDSDLGRLYREYFPNNIEILSNGGRGLAKLFKTLDPVSGRKRGRPSNFNLSGVVDAAVDLMKSNLEKADITLNVSGLEGCVCYGYREDLQAGLLNIIENATHWLSTDDNEFPSIGIEASQKRGKVFIEVSNNGPLIDSTYQDRLFDAGFSLKSDGTGLGLAIAREACRASKGDLRLDDSKPYTSFLIEFPRGQRK